MKHDHGSILSTLDQPPTKAEKIRTLARAGYLRADIARLLGVRYQHVRRVLLGAGITGEMTREGVLGFAPHGAGRNFSRTAHLKSGGLEGELQALQDRGLDIRCYCGVPDLSELPSAYKNAAAVKDQIRKYDLAEIVDEVLPYGSIMAGDWERDAPWRKKTRS